MQSQGAAAPSGELSMSQMNRPEPGDRALPLSYGDLILLSCQFDEGVGYLCEEGCVMKGVDVEMNVSSRELVFEVCTAADNRALLEYTAHLRKNGYSAQDTRLRHLETQKEMEEKANASQALHMESRTVTYGDSIQLRQPKSHGFLGVDIGQAPREEPTAKRIVLHTSRGRPVAFRIMPRFRYLVEGHTVCHGDRISLISTEFHGEYVHAHMGFETKSIGLVHEVHLSTNRTTAWVVESFFPFSMQSSQHVKAGDVVRLYHPFHAAHVAVNTGQGTVFLEPSHGALSSTMWVVRDENPLAGGLVRIQNSYSFMHLVTRKHLTVKQLDKLDPALKIEDAGVGAAQIDDDAQRLFAAVEVNSSKGVDTLMTLEPLEDDRKDAHMTWGGRVRLLHTQSRHYLHCLSAYQLKDPIRRLPAAHTAELVRRRGLVHLAEQADPDAKATGMMNMPDRVLVASPALFREDSFDVVKVPEEQVRAVDALANSLPALEEYLVTLQEVVEENLDVEDVAVRDHRMVFPEDRILDVIEKLTELQSYVYTSGYANTEINAASISDSAEGSLAQPRDYCQNFMRDLGVAELLMAVLQHSCRIFYMQVDDEMKKQESQTAMGEVDGSASLMSMNAASIIDEEELQEHVKLLEVLAKPKNRTGRLVCQLCYGVLYHMVYKHTVNANFLSQYMSQIQDQLILELGAEKLLLAMLTDNEPLLLAMASDATKEKHVTFHVHALAERGKNAMHLRFLSSMCAAGDRGVSRHQDLVLPQLLANQRKILLDIKCFNKALSLRDWYADLSDLEPGDQDLGLICSGALRPGEKGARLKRMLDYFVESLFLLATLCKPDTSGRREFLVFKVRELMSIDMCIMCLQDDGLPEHLRRNMCEFVRVVYVQDDSFRMVTRLEGVSIWNDLDAAEKLPVAVRGTGSGSQGAQSENKGELDAQTDDTETRVNPMHELKSKIKTYLEQNTCQYYPGRRAHSNLLKLSMIRLCRELVLYGHYSDEAELQAVVKEACVILDFSSMRFIDASRHESLGTSKGANPEASDAQLTEHTISLALQHLRPLCKDIPPIELARFRSAFKCRVFEAGTSIVNAGDIAVDMFVIQSGAAFMIQTKDGVESVVDTVGPGEVFGVDTLVGRDKKKTWQWRVRCSQRVTALHLSASALYAVSDEMARKGRMAMTDGLETVLETKREACALINDIYDLRLAVRTNKMLQEYRFDLNISNKVYLRCMLSDSGEQATNIILKFPSKQDSDDVEIPEDFLVEDYAVLGPLSEHIQPWKACVFGVLRIDHAVLAIAFLQYLLASTITIILALRLKNLLEVGVVQLASGEVAPASTTVGVHPGLTSPMIAIVINLAVTVVWSFTQLGMVWSASSHSRTGQKLGSLVQCMSNPLGAKIAYIFQVLYLLFWVCNTMSGVVGACIALSKNAEGASSALLTQSLWLVVGTVIGVYNGIAFASLYVHLERPALFLHDFTEEQIEGEEQQALMPRREFLKILEYLDLDEHGSLSQTLADLIISPYQALVVDAFQLLVRTHESHKELHSQLVNMLLLDVDADGVIEDPRGLNDIADALTNSLLGVTNAMQAYVVERSNEQLRLNEKKAQAKRKGQLELKRKSMPNFQLTFQQNELEKERENELARLQKVLDRTEKAASERQTRDIKQVEPLLKELLVMMDDPVREREKVHRRLLQRKGMHRIILRLLGCLPADYTETTGPLCYWTLARLCDDAPNIQAELAQHAQVFAGHFDSIPHEVATLLSAIYKDNVDLCYKIDENIISRLVSLMRDELATPYLVLAKIIITPKDQIVRRNQNLITKHLDANDVQLSLFSGLGGRTLRKFQLSDSDSQGAVSGTVGRGKSSKAKQHLHCHLASIDLLTACMAEYNHDNKKRCRGGNPNLTLTLADLEADLYDRDVPVSVKVSLVAFLQQAYILVDMTNMILLMQPEIANIFDQLARWIELLPMDLEGSKIRRLSKSERALLTDTYMAATKAFFSMLPASDLRQRDSARVRVAGHLLEALVDLVLTSRDHMEGEEELRVLQVIMLLAHSVKDSFDRFKWIVAGDDKQPENRLKSVLGVSELTPNDEDEENDEKDQGCAQGKCQRQLDLEKEHGSKLEATLQEKLTVPEGVVVFGDEFLDVMSGPGSPTNEFEALCAAFMQAKPLAQVSQTSRADGGKGEKGSGGDDEGMLVSDHHMKSLVDLLTTSESLTPAMQQTGLAILKKVVEVQVDGTRFVEAQVDSNDPCEWLRIGVPKMVIHLMTATSSNDSIVLECLNIAIVFLTNGKRPAQDAFYKLLTKGESKAPLFQKLRDRLVRGERGLSIFHNTFLRLSEDLGSQCTALGQVLTIEGVEDLTRADRLVQFFLGSYPQEVLRLLQLMCEGHNRDMQEYMRFQGTTSIDMVTCAADFVVACSRHMHPASIGFAIQCVDSLIEFVQNPCYRNQRALVDTQLPHVLNQFLQLTADLSAEFADVDVYVTNISELKTKSVTLLLSLLERVDDRFIPSRILKALEMDKLVHSINALRKDYLRLKHDEEPEEDEEAGTQVAEEMISEHREFQVACSLFMLFKMLQYFDDNKVSGLASKCNKTHIFDIERLEANCGFIEISRDNRLERIFFQIPAVCRYLSRASKTAILREVNRDNHQDQMLDFVERAQVRYDEMLHLQALHKSVMYQSFLVISPHLDMIFFMNAVIVNCVALLAFRYKDGAFGTLQTPANIILDSPWDELILVLTIFQLFFAVARLMGYYVESGILRVKRIFAQDDDYYQVATELYGGPRYYYLFTRILVTDGYFLLLCFYVCSTLVALGLRSQTRLSMFLVMLHLVDMFNLSPSLANVTAAVSSRAGTLFQTAILAFVMMYIYSAVGFVTFAEYFSFEAAEVEGGDEKDYNVNAARCDTIWKCFLVTVDMGLRKGDIGGALEDIQWRDIVPGTFIEECDSPPGLEYMGCLGIGGDDVGPFIFLRIIYTSTFFIFINTILINIIFGVIIDTFGDLREQNQAMEEEMEHRCFVCGLERYKFEINSTDGNGFEKHICDDHNMWIYLYFIVYLFKKDVFEQTGFESYVFDKLNEVDADGEVHHKMAPDVSWFPCNEAMAITDTRDSKKETQLGLRLDKLSSDAQLLASTANAHMQAVLQLMEKDTHDQEEAMAVIDEESSDEDEEGLSEMVAAYTQLGVRAVEALGEELMEVGEGVHDAATRLSGNLNEASLRFGTELAHLADEGYDNIEVLLLCMCIYRYLYVYVRMMYTYLCISVCVYVHVHVFMYMYLCTCVYTYLFLCVYMYIYIMHMYIYICICIRARVYIYIHMYMYIRIYVYIYTYMCIYIYIYTYSCVRT